MAIRKAIYEKVKKGVENYINKGKIHNRSKRIGELYKSGKTDEAEKAIRKIKTRDKLVGIGSGIGATVAYSKYKESPYKIDISVKKKTADASTPSYKASSSSSNAKKVAANKVKVEANKVNQARKEQLAALVQKNKAITKVQSATTGKEKIAANKSKVAANSKEIAAAKKKAAANKKKVEANKARYKKG